MFRENEEEAIFGSPGSLDEVFKRDVLKSLNKRWTLPVAYEITGSIGKYGFSVNWCCFMLLTSRPFKKWSLSKFEWSWRIAIFNKTLLRNIHALYNKNCVDLWYLILESDVNFDPDHF